jgi:chitinase
MLEDSFAARSLLLVNLQMSVGLAASNYNANYAVQDKIVCDREDMTFDHYGETWAAYKLASVVGALAATNKSSIVVVGGGHGHVGLRSQDEHCSPC